MKTSDFKKGEWVIYTASDSSKELGRVKRCNEQWVFVVFSCNNDWANFANYTGARCHPGRLIIIE